MCLYVYPYIKINTLEKMENIKNPEWKLKTRICY